MNFIEDVKRQSAHAHSFQAFTKFEESVSGGELTQFTAGKMFAREIAQESRSGANPYLLSVAMTALMGMKDIGLVHGFCVELQRELARA
jgi:hypothetical protein